MSVLMAKCPRCLAVNMTFTVMQFSYLEHMANFPRYELFCKCRNCSGSTIFLVTQNYDGYQNNIVNDAILKMNASVNSYFEIDGHVSLKNEAVIKAPEHLPGNIADAFNEGATCLAVECWNAAGAMFRKCVDIATKSMIPEENIDGMSSKIRYSLGLRLEWLFTRNKLSSDLRELSHSIKEDGNDGGHGESLSKHDADDLLDFTESLLNRLYTEPKKIDLAQQRRIARRSGS